MTKSNRFSQASEEGHFDGLVDDGEYLRQSLLYKQILPRTPSRQIMILAYLSSRSLAKNLSNQRNPRLTNDLRLSKALYISRDSSTNVMSALQIHLFMQNKAKFQKVKLNVNKVLAMDYEQMDTWSIRKKQSQTKPKRTQF